MEQILACLLAEMSFDKKIDSNQKELKEEMKTNQAEVDAWRKERTACQDEPEACLEEAKTNPVKTKAGLEEMGAVADVFQERLNKMDTTDLMARDVASGSP
jgi:hypothetical protein